MYRHAIINPYLVTRGNKGRAGINVKRSEHGLRNQLFELVRFWTNQCARSHATQRKVAISARPYVSFNFLIKYHSIELETIPLNENEYEKGQHSLIIAPGKIARACVVCDSRTRYFCYGCSADVPTVVHCCSSSRDGGRDCFANLHRVRKPNHQGDTRIFHRRRRVSDAKDAERAKRRRQRFKDPEKPQSRQLRGSKKGCKLNPHHTT